MIIFEDRYYGTYSGGVWIAMYLSFIPADANSDDVTASNYWLNYISNRQPFGKGDTPNEALESLLRWSDEP